MDERNVMLGLLREFLEARDYAYDLRPDGQSLRTGVQGRHAVLTALVALQDEPMRLGVFVRMPSVVPEHRRLQMAEAIIRANDGLALGGFDMNMSEGTMDCKATMPIADGTVTAEQFDDLLFCALSAADRYYPAFNRLLYGDDLSPAEAIAEVEMAA